MSITGNDVLAFRERRGLSRRQLAEQSGLTEGKIWRIEKGTIRPDEMRALILLGVEAVTGELIDLTASTETTERTEPPADIEPSTPIVVTAEPVQVIESGSEPPAPEVDFDQLITHSFDRYVSNSEIQTFKRCRRKWWLGWHRGLSPKLESPVGPRAVGDRVHRALKEHYIPGTPNPADHMLEVLDALIVSDYDALSKSLGGNIPEELQKKFTSDANLERIMLEGYVQWLAETGSDGELEIVSSETYLESELDPMLTELSGKSVAIIGKLDVRARRVSDGVRLFIDHKTVADVNSPALTLVMNEQMLHYHLLELLGGDQERCDGALYNMLRRVKRTANAKPPFYKRIEVRHNNFELNNYHTRLYGEVSDMLLVGKALDEDMHHQIIAYPRPSRDCTWDCPFFSVCPMFDDNSRAEDMLSQYFVKTDPLAYYMEGENE